MPLAHGEGGVAGVAQKARQGGGRAGQAPVVAGEGQRNISQKAHADGVVVPAGEEARTGGRAQGGDVEAVERRPTAGQVVERRRRDVRPEGAEVPEPGVVEDDGDHIGCPGRRLDRGRKPGGRLGDRKADLLRFVHAQRVDRDPSQDGCAGLTWHPMQGHVPPPPQPHFPEGLGPFIGYVATREPRPLDARAPAEPGYGEVDESALDVFDDVGEWEPMHRPLIQVTAVILSVSLVVAGVGTVLEVLLSSH